MGSCQDVAIARTIPRDAPVIIATFPAKNDIDYIELPAREFTMAETFCRYPGQVISREQLLDYVWGYDSNPGSNIVDVYVGYLCKKLVQHGGNKPTIWNV